MKALTIIILILFNIIQLKAQDSSNKKIANVILPKRTQQVSTAEFNDYAKKIFRTKVEELTNGDFFITGKFLVSTHQMELKYTLEKWKMSQEAMSQQLGTRLDASNFMYFNNKRYYILEDHLQDESTIWFFSEPHERKTFSGFIKFKTTDRDEAYKYLNVLLSNVEFKK